MHRIPSWLFVHARTVSWLGPAPACIGLQLGLFGVDSFGLLVGFAPLVLIVGHFLYARKVS